MTTVPLGVSYGRVRGKLVRPENATSGSEPTWVAAKGSITFSPSISHIADDVDDVTVVPTPTNVKLDGNGQFDVFLVATDDPDLNPGDWTYEVSFNLDDIHIPSFHIHVPVDSNIDFSDLLPVEESTGEATLRGPVGLSAYEIAVNNGFIGTEEEWLASLGGEPAYSEALGDGATKVFTVTHSLNSTAIIYSVLDTVTNDYVFPTVTLVDSNTVTVRFGIAPTIDQYIVTIKK